MFQSNVYYFMSIEGVYCVYTRNLGANLWLLLGAKSMPFGCMSMARLGACMRLLGANYAVVGCVPDSR